MKCSNIGLGVLISSFISGHLAAGGLRPTTERKVYAYPALSSDSFWALPDFIVTLYGTPAREIYGELNPTGLYSGAPVVRDNVSCYSMIKSQVQEYACNLKFHPNRDSELTLSEGGYTFTLHPEFVDGTLGRIMIDATPGAIKSPLIDRSCFNLKNEAIFIRKMLCSYKYEWIDSPVKFPDGENPQGVAVGWGVYTEQGERLL